MIGIGVIGCGQWGPNHIRNFSSLPSSRVWICCDLNSARLQVMAESFRGVRLTKDYREVLRHPNVDAIVIATPAVTHYRLVKECLLAGKDVLCEKPLCMSAPEAKELVRLASTHRRVLMVGHVFVFNSGIRKLRQLIEKGQCGRLYYLHSERTNLGPFRNDVSAVWDLACHDVYIFNYLLAKIPKEVSARGGRYLQSKIEDVAFISLIYPGDILVNIHVSWLDPRKVRQITVVGDKKMVIWDDLDNVGPVKIYNRQVVQRYYYETFGEFALLAKEGNITIPKVELYEPLKAQDAHFLASISKRQKPLTDGKTAFDTIRTLTAIQNSLRKKGSSVRVA